MEINVEYQGEALAMLLGAAQAFMATGEGSRARALLRAALLLESTSPRALLDGIVSIEEDSEGTPCGLAVPFRGRKYRGSVAATKRGLIVHAFVHD